MEPEPTDLAYVQTDQSDGLQPSETSDEVARIPSPLSEISPGTGTNDTPVDEQEQVNELGVKDTASGSEETINEWEGEMECGAEDETVPAYIALVIVVLRS